ncbi:MAG: putative quinol monooxygenase [Desulfobacterales bacterium]
MNPIAVVATLKAKAGKEAELRKELLALISPTRQEPGCLRYDLHEELEHPEVFVFYEQWKSPGHLEEHLTRPHMEAFRAKMDDLLSEMPDIRVLETIG